MNLSDVNGMNTNYSLKQLGAYHMIGDDDYEPQRTNNFELHVYLGTNANLKTIDSGAKIDTSLAQDCLTLSVQSAGQIATDVGIIEVPYGNTKVKFAGLPNISSTDIVFSDYLGKATERVIAAWHGKVFNPKTQIIGKASDYKKTAVLIETAPDGSSGRAWQLKGLWPSHVQYGAYDYSNANVRQITVTFSYDIAIPLDS